MAGQKMSLKVYTSCNINNLVCQLAEDIKSGNKKCGGFFESPKHKIVIPSLVNKNWLNYELLSRGGLGSVINIFYDTLNWCPYRIVKELGSDHLEQTATEKDLFFDILRILEDGSVMNIPEMKPVLQYITDENEKLQREKKFEFAKKTASLFVKYIDSNTSDVREDDVIGKWNGILDKYFGSERDGDTDISGIMKSISDCFSSSAEKFEFIIYSELMKSRIENDTETNINRLSILKKFDLNKSSDKLKLYVFNYPYMTPGQADIIKLFSEKIDVFVYINTLNDSLTEIAGKNIQKTYLENFENIAEIRDDYIPPKNSLDYFKSKNRQEKIKQDTSFQITACPGVYREAETVYNSVIYNLNKNENIKPEDIGVVICGGDEYYSAVHGVFSEHSHKIPVNFACAMPNADNQFIGAIKSLISLFENNFSRDSVIEFFKNPCVQKKFKTDQKDLNSFIKTADEKNIWHFFSSKEKSAFFGKKMESVFTWDYSAKNLRHGNIMDCTGDEKEAMPEWNGIFPQKSMDYNPVFFTVLEKINTELKFYSKEAEKAKKGYRSVFENPADVVICFRDFIDEFIEDNTKGDSVKILIDNSLEDYTWQVGLRKFYPDFLDIYSYLKMVASDQNYVKGKPFAGGVCVGKFFNMRLNNFKILYIMGLNEGTFPGEDEKSSLDITRNFSGRISKTDEDKYGLLKLINNTQEKVYLSYNSYDPEKDADKYASGIVEEICDYMNEFLEYDFKRNEMPLLGNSIVYFSSSEKPEYTDIYVNYSEDDFALALYENSENETVLKSADISEYIKNDTSDNDFNITVKDIADFINNPCDYGMKSLGLKNEYTNNKDIYYEPVEPDKFVLQNIAEEAVLKSIQEGKSAVSYDLDKNVSEAIDRISEKYKNSGRLPLNLFSFNKEKSGNKAKIINQTETYKKMLKPKDVFYKNISIGNAKSINEPESYWDPLKIIFDESDRNKFLQYTEKTLKNVNISSFINVLSVSKNNEITLYSFKSNKEKNIIELKLSMMLISLLKVNSEVYGKIGKTKYGIICGKEKDIKEYFVYMSKLMQTDAVFETMPSDIYNKLSDNDKKSADLDNVFTETLKDSIDDQFGKTGVSSYVTDLPYNFFTKGNVVEKFRKRAEILDSFIELIP